MKTEYTAAEEIVENIILKVSTVRFHGVVYTIYWHDLDSHMYLLSYDGDRFMEVTPTKNEAL